MLGFRILRADTRDQRLAERHDVRGMLRRCPNNLPVNDLGSPNGLGSIDVEDADALHAELTARGAERTLLADSYCRMRELTSPP